MYQTEADLQEDRRRRLLYALLAVSMFVSVAICGTILYFVLAGRESKRLLGQDATFGVGQVTEVAVKRLEVSMLLPNSPKWSDDIVFVIKQRDNSYQAFLGLDPLSGCKLNWRQPRGQFVDDCSGVSYTINGADANGVRTLSSTPQRMIELPVKMQGNDVYVLDQILRRDVQ